MRDLNEKSAEVELYHHAQPYSNSLDSESRSTEKPSFRINEQSLELILIELRFSNQVILTTILQGRVWSLCNYLFLKFSMNLFETVHTCCLHNENVYRDL